MGNAVCKSRERAWHGAERHLYKVIQEDVLIKHHGLPQSIGHRSSFRSTHAV